MASYTYTTLNDPSAVNGTDATGINDNGQIVGYYFDGSGNEYGFEFSNGSYIAVNNNNTGYKDIMPLGINNEGNIVGDNKTQGPFGQLQLGFLDSAGTFNQIFGTNDGQTPGYFATGINSQNVIVGYLNELIGPETREGFIDNGGSTTVLDYSTVNSQTTSTIANGVNADNEVVGYFIGTDPNQAGSNTAHGFIYNNGTYSYFDDPHAVNGTFAEGINNADMIVGYYVDGDGISHGFILNQPTGVYTTINIPGATNTFIHGINNEGQLVGTYETASGQTFGFVTTDLPLSFSSTGS